MLSQAEEAADDWEDATAAQLPASTTRATASTDVSDGYAVAIKIISLPALLSALLHIRPVQAASKKSSCTFRRIRDKLLVSKAIEEGFKLGEHSDATICQRWFYLKPSAAACQASWNVALTAVALSFI